MSLFGGVIQINGITYQLLVVFVVILGGYLLGRITIKGTSLSTAGVFIAAIIFGALFSKDIHRALTSSGGSDITSDAFRIIANIGLCLFVGSVGMIAGPAFFSSFKKSFRAYIIMGVVIVVIGAAVSLLCFLVGMSFLEVPAQEASLGITKSQYVMAMIVGIMSGALTSTPALSAAQQTAAGVVCADASDAIQNVISTGHGIAYLFGVIGVVLFVQIVPRLLKVDMEKEKARIAALSAGDTSAVDPRKKRFEMDHFGIAAFSIIVIAGIFLGAIRIPLTPNGLSGITFSLTITGGVLISGIVFSWFGHLGPISLLVKKQVLELFREFGLVLFLVGTGIPAGSTFVSYFRPVYFLFGVVITIVPMVAGYFLGRKLMKIPVLLCLGAITGGMTSTPALGTLIRTTGSDEGAASYASTYPFALLCIVLASQFMILLS